MCLPDVSFPPLGTVIGGRTAALSQCSLRGGRHSSSFANE